MKHIYLKESILVKDNGDQVLTIDVETDEILHFKGDVAKIVVILSQEHANEINAVAPDALQRKLAHVSKTFSKNRSKKQAILEVLNHLKKIGILDEKS